jgi:hypothetical protein
MGIKLSRGIFSLNFTCPLGLLKPAFTPKKPENLPKSNAIPISVEALQMSFAPGLASVVSEIYLPIVIERFYIQAVLRPY